ncbi:hypothetical protein [Amycolatopsis sp. CA-230715]|uniref:hypothetical protein n=1 Tax=Amycolatopsis sp. CA-230715 TaxID=2745196 RepID=UPI001C32CA52|nr:hypothetical protein [Amycolatopsis sp. CA-230715]QWF77346.1 hypothetical protein HUW46_00738 [Amycolatopsis sp. CA-230715]
MKRPKKKLMVEVSEVVSAPAADVLEALETRLTGAPNLEVDRERGTVACQGGWWYRGEYEVVGEPGGGARVTHRVYNVADRLRWGVPLANRLFIGFRQATADGFARFARELG